MIDEGKMSLNPQWEEVKRELLALLTPDQHLVWQGLQAPTIGHVYALSIRNDEYPGSDLVAVTNEKLLAKLRSVKGQFVDGGLRIFYYEYLMSTADFKVFTRTGNVPTRG